MAQNPPTYYVDLASANPQFPYTSWATAARTIPEGINAGTTPGRVVLVANGVYRTGTVEANGLNRVALTNVTLRSVNGPALTVIDGEGAVRCAYLGDSAILSGFTLQNGKATDGGGVLAVATGVVTNCVLNRNTGRGASGATLDNCILEGNLGGGAESCTLYNCALTANSAKDNIGGGARNSTLYNCTLTGNCASSGGGAADCTLRNCVLTGNRAKWGGSGLWKGVEPLGWSWDGKQGGGAWMSTLYNCTVTGNAAGTGGGLAGGTLDNCLVYYNQADREPNWGTAFGFYRWSLQGGLPWSQRSAFEHSCTFPLPSGPGNISVDPQLASATHLSATSPCLGAGDPAYASGVDIDGEPWASPPAIGADQVRPGQCVGPLTVRIEVPFTRFAAGFAVALTADIAGPALRSVWDFDDGTVVTNQCFIRHAWALPGTYTVRLTGYNDSHPEGVTTSLEVTVIDPTVHYVNVTIAAPVFPYTTWETAATNIQDAVDAGMMLGRVVLVTNGVYRAGAIGALTFSVSDFTGFSSLVGKLKQPTRPVDTWLVTQLSAATTAALAAYEGEESDPTALARALVLDLNRILNGDCIYDEQRFAGIALRPETQQLLWEGGDQVQLNRLLLEDAYPCELPEYEDRGPSRVVLDNVVVRSVNGPEVTVIEGAVQNPDTGEGFNIRCAYVGDDSVLSGFTLTKGAGGVLCAPFGVVTNCTLTANSASGVTGGTLYNCAVTGNSGNGADGGTLFNCALNGNAGCGASGSTLYNCILEGNMNSGASDCALYNCTVTGNSAEEGGGVSRSTLHNCIVTGNAASSRGGGACRGVLSNCTVTGNTAYEGGGAAFATLYNCTVTANSATERGGGLFGGTLYNCLIYFNQAPLEANWIHWDDPGWPEANIAFDHSCTTPLPPGPGNIDADPRFVNAAAGDFRLRPDSPCIDTGTNLVDLIATDILGVPRPLDGDDDGIARFDMGAYEFDPSVPLIIITRVALTPAGVRLEWPVTALGSKLQRTTSLQNPLWQEVAGSETATNVTLPVVNAAEFFRLVKP